jgi:hypothetical protein
MPVGDKEEALVLVLHTHPVIESADEVSQVKSSRGAHAAEHAFAMVGS